MSASFPTRLVLGSGSWGRRQLLTEAGYTFDILPADIEEPSGEGATDIRAFVQHVAWLKANAVAPRVASGIVLTADSVAWLDGQVIGKPTDEADARRILRFLGGRVHELWTGVCLWRRPDNVQLAWQEGTRVEFVAMSEVELEDYLATRTWRGCSGAYAITGPEDPRIRIVEGSVSNVVGLPLESLARYLPAFAAGGA